MRGRGPRALYCGVRDLEHYIAGRGTRSTIMQGRRTQSTIMRGRGPRALYYGEGEPVALYSTPTSPHVSSAVSSWIIPAVANTSILQQLISVSCQHTVLLQTVH